jgi:hypothetical protein
MAAWRQLLDKAAHPANPAERARKALQDCLTGPAFAGVRGPEALAILPEAEGRPWKELWDDIANMLARIHGMTVPQR